MSKIICDMCGTAYPESADLCPICGCSKGENPQIVADDTPDEHPAEAARTPVKGGKFSKSNVRKRNKAAYAASKTATPAKEEGAEKERSNTGLIIAIVILLLAILATMAFIYVRYLMPRQDEKPDKGESTVQTTLAAENTDDTEAPQTDPPVVKCEDITVKTAIVELEEAGEAWLLEVTASPADTTDTVTFQSSDEAVVTVSEKGRLTAVGAGQAVITITCGDQQTKCRVVCNFQEETEPQDTTVPEETDPTEPVDPNGKISLNREDFTMSREGETWQLYNGTVGKHLVTWTSSNEAVVTVDGGVVTAVGGGIATVTAEYGDQKVSCIVRCSLPVNEENTGNDSGNGGITEDPVCTISHTDVTIAVGETFKLTLKDGGNAVNVNWKVADNSVCSVSGNTVTGKASGTTTISVSYGGNTYSCTVRVK